ncbi:MAG: hypothetical protein ACHQIM_18160, partial [Sphingobacteriales bacterium]
SAQWWRIDLKFKKTQERPPVIERPVDHSFARMPALKISHPQITPVRFDRTEYSYLAAEDIVMKAAQHNMRFRVYADASYNFSELARLYIKQNRLSEAKWYLLQSNIISRQQNDDKHTIANLMDLAFIKTNIGDYTLAQEDLNEARDLAGAKGLNEFLTEIEKRLLDLKQTRLIPAKLITRYAETPEKNSKAE